MDKVKGSVLVMEPFTLSGRMSLLTILALLLVGCGPAKEASSGASFDSFPASIAWLAKQQERWEQRVPSARTGIGQDSILRCASGGAGHIAWLEQRGSISELWYSGPGGKNKRRLLSRTAPQGFLNCSLSPDGTRILLHGKDALGDLYEFGNLDLIDVKSGSSERVSSTASDYFEPTWCDNRGFLFAQITPPDGIEVYLATSATARVRQIGFRSRYPRLVINRLAPQGWLVSDRSQPTRMHGWVCADTRPRTWTEVSSESGQARLVGWWKGAPLIVSDDGSSSRVISLDAKVFSKPAGFEIRGKEIARLGRVRFAILRGDALYAIVESRWGQDLQRVDLGQGVVEQLRLPKSNMTCHKPRLEAGRLLVMIEGPFLSPRVMEVPEVGLDVSSFLRLTHSDVNGQISLGEERVVLSGQVSKGDAPALLEAYGGFGRRLEPLYDPARLAWIDKGGSVILLQWVGQPKEQKESRDRLVQEADGLGVPVVYRGSSYGATLGLMAMLKKPTAFRAVWLDAPVTDLLHFYRSPPGESWISELGDPRTESARLGEVSPLQNLERSSYPLTVVTTSESDYVVDPRHSYALVEKAQTLSSTSAFYLGTTAQGGHSFLRPDFQWQSRIIDLLWSEALRGQDKV